MPKCEITVGKKFTLNTQNFSSVSPTLTIKLTGSDVTNLTKAHELLDIVADGLFHKQLESDAKTMAVIKKLGFAEYFKKIREQQGDMDNVLMNSIKKLSEYTNDLPF